jgi:hypothetical protein
MEKCARCDRTDRRSRLCRGVGWFISVRKARTKAAHSLGVCAALARFTRRGLGARTGYHTSNQFSAAYRSLRTPRGRCRTAPMRVPSWALRAVPRRTMRRVKALQSPLPPARDRYASRRRIARNLTWPNSNTGGPPARCGFRTRNSCMIEEVCHARGAVIRVLGQPREVMDARAAPAPSMTQEGRAKPTPKESSYRTSPGPGRSSSGTCGCWARWRRRAGRIHCSGPCR